MLTWRQFRRFGFDWTQRQTKDHWVKMAREKGFRARSAFKLLELSERYNLLRPGMRVVDLGAAPGSWSQVAAELVKSTPQNPLVLAIDILPIDPIPGVVTVTTDLSELNSIDKVYKVWTEPCDILINDMSPNHTGDRDVDCAGICSLQLDAVRIAAKLVKPGATIVMKMLDGYDEPEHYKYMCEFFSSVERVKPTASRTRSREFYYIGKGWKERWPQGREPTKDDLKTIAEQFYAAGFNLDGDMEKALIDEIGEFDKKNPKWAKLANEEDFINEFTKGKNYSFDTKAPKDVYELEEYVKKMKKGEITQIKENSSESDEMYDHDPEDPELKEREQKFQEWKDLQKKEGKETDLADKILSRSRTFNDDVDQDQARPYFEAEKEWEDEIERKRWPGDDLVFKRKDGKKRMNEYLRSLKDSDLWGKDE